MFEYLTVGKIVNTHGLRGEVRIISKSDFKEDRFKKGSQLFIETDNSPIPVTITNHRTHKNFDLLTFEGMNHINDVEKYKGLNLLVSAEELEELPDTEFYFHEIIGCVVKDTEGELIGEISDILKTGANDVWVVKRENKKDALIPYIEHVVKSVDVGKKQVIIEVVEGLLP